LIVECPYDCIVGNGYAAILPFFHEQWGPGTKIVHLRRVNRDACIAGLIKNCELFPGAYRNYTAAEGATIERIAAFHFGEMSKDDWHRMPTVAKFGWYYDKTHALIEQHRGLFAEYVEISTETLSEESTRRTLARMACVSNSLLPPPTHLNAQTFDITSVAEEHRDKAIWLLGNLSWESLVEDDVYAIKYFLDMFVAWTGHQISGGLQLGRSKRRSPNETAATLQLARAVLAAAIKDIDKLEDLNLACTPDRARPRKDPVKVQEPTVFDREQRVGALERVMQKRERKRLFGRLRRALHRRVPWLDSLT